MERENETREKTAAPKTMEACREAVNTLLTEGYLLLSLEGVEPGLAQRMMDFVMGAAAALHATINRESDRIFSVSIEDDERSYEE